MVPIRISFELAAFGFTALISAGDVRLAGSLGRRLEPTEVIFKGSAKFAGPFLFQAHETKLAFRYEKTDFGI